MLELGPSPWTRRASKHGGATCPDLYMRGVIIDSFLQVGSSLVALEHNTQPGGRGTSAGGDYGSETWSWLSESAIGGTRNSSPRDMVLNEALKPQVRVCPWEVLYGLLG